MWFSILFDRPRKQDLLILDTTFKLDLVDSFPKNIRLLLTDEVTPHYVPGLRDGEVHIFEKHPVLAEVAQDIGIPGGIVKEFSVLDHLEVVIVLVDGIEGHFVGSRHVTTRGVPHFK